MVFCVCGMVGKFGLYTDYLFFLSSQIMITRDISYCKIETNTEISRNVKVTNVQNTTIQLEDSTEIPYIIYLYSKLIFKF